MSDRVTISVPSRNHLRDSGCHRLDRRQAERFLNIVRGRNKNVGCREDNMAVRGRDKRQDSDAIRNPKNPSVVFQLSALRAWIQFRTRQYQQQLSSFVSLNQSTKDAQQWKQIGLVSFRQPANPKNDKRIPRQAELVPRVNLVSRAKQIGSDSEWDDI